VTQLNEERYYADLTPYTHQISPHTLAGVFNVGWLDPRSAFATGKVPVAFVDRLLEIAGSTGDFNALVEPIRELPRCEVCGEIELRNSRGVLIPNSELWIPAGNRIYASPITIVHFVQAHSYRPPDEYIDAVLDWHGDVTFNADAVYRQKLKESDWFRARAAGRT
jgi:hypothetical protein